MPDRPFTTRAKRALDSANDTARVLGHDYVGTEHLLLGLVSDETSPAAQILYSLGVKAEHLRAETFRLMWPNAESSGPGA